MRRWHIILICFLVVGLGAFIGSKLTKPLYQSSVLVQVVIRSGSVNLADYNNLQASDQLVQTEADLATDDSVLRAVASHYPDLSAGQLAGEVSANIKTNTQLFEIDVVDPDPDRAATLANDVAATLIKQQLQEMQQDNAQAQQQIQQNLNQTSQQIDATTTNIAALQQAKSGNQGQIASLQRKLSGLQQLYNQWQTALAQLELTQAQSGNPLRIVHPAQPSYTPTRPNVLLQTGVGFMVGLSLGLLLVLLFERLDTRVRAPGEIAKLLALPVLATIWRASSSKPEDMINPTRQSINNEPFRMLRTNIGFSSPDKRLHSMIVTSPQKSDGKSVIAANLAIFMASAGKNTLLIDADLRHPVQHALFRLLPNKMGLSDAVMAFSRPTEPRTPAGQQFVKNASNPGAHSVQTTTDLSLEPFIHVVGIPNLWIMPSGPLPPNPAEFLESKVMQRFLSVIANSRFEAVIFDTPPLLGLSDASILASKVDGALIVVDTTRATKEKLKQVKAALSQTGVYVLGCVANKLQYKGSENAYYYYTEDQDNGDKSTKNGHMPGVPVTSSLVEHSDERKFHPN
jgi:capsular exopolysaccharide synthesis family protein